MKFDGKLYPKNGDVRTQSRFLLFPKKINGEWRWLEFAKYEEVRDENYGNWDDWDWRKWNGVRWLS